MNVGESAVQPYWDSRTQIIERLLYSLHARFTFKLCLGDDASFLWTKRCGRKWRVVLCTPDSHTGKYEYTPFMESDYGELEKYGPRLLEFFTKLIQYCELEPIQPW